MSIQRTFFSILEGFKVVIWIEARVKDPILGTMLPHHMGWSLGIYYVQRDCE